MSYTHFNDTTPKAAKDYFCELCDRKINKGEKHIARRGVFDNEVETLRMHIDCENLSQEWDDNQWENQDVFEFRKDLELLKKREIIQINPNAWIAKDYEDFKIICIPHIVDYLKRYSIGTGLHVENERFKTLEKAIIELNRRLDNIELNYINFCNNLFGKEGEKEMIKNKELDWQKKLFDKYPKLFQEKDLSMQVTCMCWGIETDEGWSNLIDETCAKLEKYKICFTQVKEKFGGIRLYYRWRVEDYTPFEKFKKRIYYSKIGKFLIKAFKIKTEDEIVFDIIMDAEHKSYDTCEICGKEGKISDKARWYKALCKTHRDELGYKIFEEKLLDIDNSEIEKTKVLDL